MGEPYKSWMDPVVFQSLITVCPAYAPGTRVTLSTGMECAVIDWDPRDPCRPKVTEITHFEDDEGGETIDLREHHEISIVESEGHDVREYNFYPEHEHAFDLRMVEKTMTNGIYSLDPELIEALTGKKPQPAKGKGEPGDALKDDERAA